MREEATSLHVSRALAPTDTKQLHNIFNWCPDITQHTVVDTQRERGWGAPENRGRRERSVFRAVWLVEPLTELSWTRAPRRHSRPSEWASEEKSLTRRASIT